VTEQPPQSLFKRWVHVHEEDTDDARVYRAYGADIPPARGRRGLEFRDDGTFVEYKLGPVDRPEGVEGHWDADAADRIRVDVPDPAREAETLEILSVEGDKLEIKKK
jgi:hypothetical protein